MTNLPEHKAVVVELYQPRHIPAVTAFNKRLLEGNETLRFPECPTPHRLPRGKHEALFQEYFVAREGEEVRGGFFLKWQPFWIQGQIEPIAYYQLPLSEGIVNRDYGMVGVLVFRDALRRSPNLFMLGLGGRSEPAARLAAATKWHLVDCPFYFYVAKPFRFFRGLAHLRRKRSRRWLLDIAAFCGLGSVGVRTAQWLRYRACFPEYKAETIDVFGDWADRIWESARGNYTFIAQRDASILNLLYPSEDPRFIRLKVSVEGDIVGWAILMNTPMKEDKYFGNLQVGTVVDCLAISGYEGTVIAEARQALVRGGVDLIVTNQLAGNWRAAFSQGDFFEGPSNFILAVSPCLAARLDPFCETALRIHMTRGDGDGPK